MIGRQLLRKLAQWNRHLIGFSELLKNGPPEVTTTSSPDTEAPLLESLGAVLNFSKIKEQTLASKALKNLQGMAAGLIWILEVKELASIILLIFMTPLLRS